MKWWSVLTTGYPSTSGDWSSGRSIHSTGKSMTLEDLTLFNGLTLQVNLNHTGEAPWHQRRDVRLTEARP